MANYSFEELKPGYEKLWQQMSVTRIGAVEAEAKQVIKNKAKYAGIQQQTGVPWFVVGALHIREAGSPPDFKAVLHNGERIINTGRKTKLVPKGRGPFGDPDGFRKAAYDALVTVEHLNAIKWDEKTGIARCAWLMEKFNGFGYRGHGIPSPYLWGSTSVQRRGKYVSDGVYNANVTDQQIGGMAILKCVMGLDPSARFGDTVPVPKPDPIVTKKEVPPGTKTAVSVWAPLIALATYFQEYAWWIVGGGVVLTVVIIAVMHVIANNAPQLSPKAIDEEPPVVVPPVVEVPPNATV